MRLAATSWHALVRPTPTGAASPARDDSRAENVRRSNGGVRRVEILPGNVGYLDLTAFWRPAEAQDAIAAAMRLLSRADALIIDMRTNGGAAPDTVAVLVSYFFDEPGLVLFQIAHRSGEPTSRYATVRPGVPGREGRRPVYVLTAERTFSAGEGLAFLLQERRRAEVIGEVTAGAANPGRPYPLNSRFEVTVPNGKVRSALSGQLGRRWRKA